MNNARTYLSIVFIVCTLAFAEPTASANAPAALQKHECELLIVGATESGWAAAIQAARMGVNSIIIVHDGEWYGGQYTEQSLACVDEDKGVGKVGWGVDWHPMKRSFHRSGLFKEVMDRIETFNEKKYGAGMPGLPYHGPSTFHPAEAEQAFRELIQPYIDSKQIQVIWNHAPVAVEVTGKDSSHPRIRQVTFAPVDLQTGKTESPDVRVNARLTIDASDWGDVIQLAGAEYECGPDPQSRYGEPSAPPEDEISHNEMNPITWAMIVEDTHKPSPIERPENFDDRNYPRATGLSMNGFGKGLEWDRPIRSYGGILHWPAKNDGNKRMLSVYSVRRIVVGNKELGTPTAILLNYMNGQDYPLERLPARVVAALEEIEAEASQKNIVEMTREERQVIFDDAKQHSLGVLFHMQNYVHEHAADQTHTFRNFRLSPEFGTPDNLPPKPYIREGLRLKAMYMMREQDGRNRDGFEKTAAKERFSEVLYPDGLFPWQFHYDFHRTGRTYLKKEGDDGPWIDFEKPGRHTRFVSDRSVFPLRSLIPIRFDGLLGAQGNVGFSSIVSAAIRLHDQRIHIGQAAGAAAAVSLQHEIELRQLIEQRTLFEEIRAGLCSSLDGGIPLLLWPFRDLPADHPAFTAINRLHAAQLLSTEATEVDFRPDDPAKQAWIQKGIEQIYRSSQHRISLPKQNLTRGEFASEAWNQVKDLSIWKSWPHWDAHDTDHDNIANVDDALPFISNEPIIWEINRPKPTPETDGLLNETLTKNSIMINFGDRESKQSGFLTDVGAPFNSKSGYGWGKDLQSQTRIRNAVPESYRDSFVFTRTLDRWEYELPNGECRVTICVGDSGHDQVHQNVSLEGNPILTDITTTSGLFQEVTASVIIRDHRLTVDIGHEKHPGNTCLNWILIQPVN